MRWSVLILVAGWVSGCSCIVQFDPESQPCDTAGQCDPDFFCSGGGNGDAGLCKRRDGGAGGFDGGGLDGSTCAPRETLCGDTRDNDCDNQIDCADSDCGGVACDDRDACTTGERCSGSVCPKGIAVICNSPPNPCQMQIGTCMPGGSCFYGPLTDGTQCGAAPAARCCAGTCIDTTVNATNCGGCGLACASGQLCQPIDQSGCTTPEPLNTSGRCGCSGNARCPLNQACGTTGICSPAAIDQCAPGQNIGMGATVCAAYCRY